MTDEDTTQVHRMSNSIQTDLRCRPGKHNLKRARFHTGPRLYGRVVVVSCDRCNAILSGHRTREPRGEE